MKFEGIHFLLHTTQMRNNTTGITSTTRFTRFSLMCNTKNYEKRVNRVVRVWLLVVEAEDARLYLVVSYCLY
jgi:hypothetical protein